MVRIRTHTRISPALAPGDNPLADFDSMLAGFRRRGSSSLTAMIDWLRQYAPEAEISAEVVDRAPVCTRHYFVTLPLDKVSQFRERFG